MRFKRVHDSMQQMLQKQKKLLKSSKCLLLGHKTKELYNAYSYDDIHVIECERCDKIIVMEWGE